MKADWQTHVLASCGYLDLGMFDDATLALEKIEPEDKTRVEVLGAVSRSIARSGNGTWRNCEGARDLGVPVYRGVRPLP